MPDNLAGWIAVAFVGLLQLFSIRYVDHMVGTLKETTRDVVTLGRDVAVLKRDIHEVNRKLEFISRRRERDEVS